MVTRYTYEVILILNVSAGVIGSWRNYCQITNNMSQSERKKNPPRGDWHPADILAALHKAGWSLRQLAIEHGYRHRSSLSVALRHPYPKAETIIARALNLPAQAIWPSRYHPDGGSNRRRGPAPLRPASIAASKTSTGKGRHKAARAGSRQQRT